MNEKICVPIDSQIVGELFLRSGPEANITNWIENVVRDYLERTAEYGGWSDAYYEYQEKQAGIEGFAATYGDPKEGYHWAPLFLPNGTLIRMEYKRDTFYAAVKFGKIEFDGGTYSPSELARKIAAGPNQQGTSRNAWRDLLLKRPGDSEWTLANDLRRRFLK